MNKTAKCLRGRRRHSLRWMLPLLLLMVGGTGCVSSYAPSGVGVVAGYSSGLPSSQGSRQVEVVTGKDITGGGPVVGLTCQPFMAAGDTAAILIGADLRYTDLSDGADVLSLSPGVRGIFEAGLGFFHAGAGLNAEIISIPGLPGRDSELSLGWHASIGYDGVVPIGGGCGGFFLPLPFVELRYRSIEYDMDVGTVDGTGFEFMIGWRLPLGLFLGDS